MFELMQFHIAYGLLNWLTRTKVAVAYMETVCEIGRGIYMLGLLSTCSLFVSSSDYGAIKLFINTRKFGVYCSAQSILMIVRCCSK